jgi:hypothetical protein
MKFAIPQKPRWRVKLLIALVWTYIFTIPNFGGQCHTKAAYLTSSDYINAALKKLIVKDQLTNGGSAYTSSADILEANPHCCAVVHPAAFNREGVTWHIDRMMGNNYMFVTVEYKRRLDQPKNTSAFQARVGACGDVQWWSQ